MTSVFFLASCVEAEAPVSSGESNSLTVAQARLYEQLQFFVDAGEIRSDRQRIFFAKEAAKAGVVAIRTMSDAEKPKRLVGSQTGCGRTTGRQILVDADRRRCIFMGNLAHEIAHFVAYRENCFGHGDRFYRLNYQMAERFEKEFPGKQWGRTRPTSSVLKRAREYRAGDSGCPGSVSIRGR